MRGLLAGLLFFICGLAHAACPPDSTIRDWVLGGGLCQAITTFGDEKADERPLLVVVVHGDISDGGAATYHVAFAKTLARPGAIVVALTRPGYTDDRGRTSEGHTYGRQDNYTPDNIAAVGGAIAALKTHYRSSRVIYVGHSGGAAIGGVLIGKSHGLIDAAVLVSCPCDIPRWLRERKQPSWSRGESPSQYAARVPRKTRVVVIAGESDTNTFPAQASGYVGSLQRRNVDARFVSVADAGHGLSGLGAATMRELDETRTLGACPPFTCRRCLLGRSFARCGRTPRGGTSAESAAFA